jgi:GTPase SAR1 family protein
MENAERFASPDFLPTIPDLLRVKLKTIGIAELTFRVSNSEFLMIDVGGQRSERRKWLPLFNDITAIIYLVALNEYEMFLEEDNVTPRLDESLQLFQRLSGSQWLRKASIILFFNKYDIFQERIKERPLKGCFEDYEEFEKKYPNMTELEKSCLFMKEKFISVFNGSRLYMFFTCALDTDNCQKVFLAVRDTIVANFIDDYEM